MDQELTPSEAHEEENVSVVMSENEAELTAQVCNVCNKSFTNLEDLLHHKKTHKYFKDLLKLN